MLSGVSKVTSGKLSITFPISVSYTHLYLLKLILTNIRESGKKILCLDPEAEYGDLTNALGGCYIDFMSGKYKINKHKTIWHTCC